MQSKDKYPENIVNPNFQKLLDKFHELIKNTPSPGKIKNQLTELKKEAYNTFLTGAQRDAIAARCDNYINGTYGSTSKPHIVGNPDRTNHK